jgi:hypothetical protein
MITHNTDEESTLTAFIILPFQDEIIFDDSPPSPLGLAKLS